MFRRFQKDRSGATAVEYGVLIMALALVIVVGVGALGDSVRLKWADNNQKVDNAFR